MIEKFKDGLYNNGRIIDLFVFGGVQAPTEQTVIEIIWL